MNDKTLKEQEHLEIIREVFQKSKKRYGYRRIHRELAKCGKTLSEKVIRRVKRKNGLEVYHPQKRKYSSYKGEITPAVPNRINRDFHANRPNEKWLTDITEFALTDGKNNSACEGFFGILKNELFYNRDLTGITRKEFKKELNEYMEWFCKDRIKMSLGGMSPVDYRKSLNLLS